VKLIIKGKNMPLRKMLKTTIITAIIFALSFVITTANDGITIKSSSLNSIIIEFTPNFNGFSKLKSSDGREILFPEIANARFDGGYQGQPAVMKVNIPITVPSPDGFEIESVTVSGMRKFDGLIAPIPSAMKDGDIFSEDYIIDNSAYSGFEIKEWAAIEYGGIARDRNIAGLTIRAAQFDKENLEILIPEKIEVKVNFKPEKFSDFVSNNFYLDRPGGESFNSTINHDETKSWAFNSQDIFKKYLAREYTKNPTGSLLESENWIKIEITEEGLYKIDASMINSLGKNISAADAATIKVFGNGGKMLSEAVDEALNNTLNEQEIIVRTKPDGTFDHILFYGAGTKGFEWSFDRMEHYNHSYSDVNYYIMTWGGEPGKRAEARPAPNGQVVNTPDRYINRYVFLEEMTNPYDYGGGRQWFGRSYFGAPIETRLHNLVKGDTIRYRISVAHQADYSGKFEIFENGNLMGDISLGSTAGSYVEAYRNDEVFAISSDRIATNNMSQLRFQYNNTKSIGATAYFDFLEINYPRYLTAIDNEMHLYTDENMNGITEYNIGGFGSGEIYGFEISDPANPVRMENLASSDGSFKMRADLDGTVRQFYFSPKAKTPKIESMEFGNLRNNFANTDVIVITHPQLIESANEFKDYREQTGLSVSVVTTNLIYNEFGAGVPDITAIRDYIAFAYHTWDIPPKYIVLWGDGHFDAKNINTQKINYVPAYQMPDLTENTYNSIYESFATDDFFGNIAGDDAYMDISVGRLNIDSPELGKWIVNKIKSYEQNSDVDIWRTNVILVADDGPAGDKRDDGALHNNQSETLDRDYIPDDMITQKIYLVEYNTENIPGARRKPGAAEALIEQINTSGGVLLNWIGHGNPRVWAHEEVMARDESIPRMNNSEKLFFVTAATCDYGRFDSPDFNSGAEDMMNSKLGGAIGVFSATRVVFAHDNARINNKFYHWMFTREDNGLYPRIGDVMFKVKSEFDETNDKKFYLMGDPTMRISIPDYRVKIDSINGIDVNEIEEPLKLMALDQVNIAASVLNQAGNAVESSFNGFGVITLKDGDKFLSMYDDVNGNQGSLFEFEKLGGTLSKGSFPVVNGKITASFIIPKDISFSGDNGRLFAYAFSSDSTKFAKGNFNQFIVDGVSDVADPDDNGPSISVFLDSREFENYDVVSGKPLLIVDLEDESGINATGLGIGHRIEAWLDDSPTSIDLTDSYESSLNDAKSGTIVQYLGEMEPGLHTLTVRAWDVYNNFSTEQVFFNINEAGDIWVPEITAYPNPFEQHTYINFRHTAAPPFDVEIGIYTLEGNLVRTLNETLTTIHTSQVLWDGLDNDGNRISQGAYLVKISITDRETKKITNKSGLLTIHIK
jgi:hypothetical protein